MSEVKANLISLSIRLLICLPVLLACQKLLGTLGSRSDAFTILGYGFILMAGFITMGLILAPPIARICSEPIGGLFWPGQYNQRPLPIYGPAESKRKQGLFEEAIEAFEQISKEHPQEIRPFLQMVEIAMVDLRDPDRAEALYRRGIRQLSKPEARAVLARQYQNVSTLLHSTHDEPRRTVSLSHTSRPPDSAEKPS